MGVELGLGLGPGVTVRVRVEECDRDRHAPLDGLRDRCTNELARVHAQRWVLAHVLVGGEAPATEGVVKLAVEGVEAAGNRKY